MLEKENEAPSGRFPDVEKAWTDFQTRYNVPGRQRPDLSAPVPAAPTPLPSPTAPSRRPGRLLRRCVLIAAAIGLFMALLVAAQAAGLDVFGSMARWTDETFHFVTAPAGNELAELRSVLREQGFPEEYAPTWVPEGFHAEEPVVSVSQESTLITSHFSNDKDEYWYTITRFSKKKFVPIVNYEKDASNVTPYSNSRQVFYIFNNLGKQLATWSDGEEFSIEVCGQLSVKDIKSVIDSIGG